MAGPGQAHYEAAQVTPFPCTSCGECCRRVGQRLATIDEAPEDGVNQSRNGPKSPQRGHSGSRGAA